jgi:hypothetical protein
VPEFFTLSRQDQRKALLVAPERSGRPLHPFEKDVCVVWDLQHLFVGPHAQHLVFKGGTSLSRAQAMSRTRCCWSSAHARPARREPFDDLLQRCKALPVRPGSLRAWRDVP